VPTGRFVGRQREVNTLFSRMLNGDSTAVVGEPHIGKSSLLNYIADEATRREWIEEYFNDHIFAYFDAQVLGASDEPEQFWLRIYEQVKDAPVIDEEIRQQCRLVAESNYSIFTLERLFRLLAQRGWRLVILIDEFESLVVHPNFYKREFFGALRSLSVQFRSFVLVIASRLRAKDLNRRLAAISTGSPFMNVFIEVLLPHLTKDEAISLIERTLKEAGGQVVFAPRDRKFLFELAGFQPFLLQTAAAALYDAHLEGASTRDAFTLTTDLFHQRTELHFLDLASSLELDEPGLPPPVKVIDRMQLRLKLHDSFSLEELELLSHDMGVDYEDLGGDGKDAKALKLVLFCQRRNLLDKLRAKCMEIRPAIEW
jgi:hypothetical protein